MENPQIEVIIIHNQPMGLPATSATDGYSVYIGLVGGGKSIRGTVSMSFPYAYVDFGNYCELWTLESFNPKTVVDELAKMSKSILDANGPHKWAYR